MRFGPLLLSLTFLAVACTADDDATPTPPTSPTSELTSTIEPTASPTATVAPTETPTPGPRLFTSPKLRSPDGSLIAYVVFHSDRCPEECAVIFDDRQGSEVARISFSDPTMSRISGAWGAHSIDVWLDDSSGVVLGGSCDCDAQAVRPVVLVMIDGSVIDRGVSAPMLASGRYVSPNGRYLLSRHDVESWEIDAIGCQLSDSADVISLLSGDVVGGIPPSATAITDWQWLDGSNLAYELRPRPDPEDGRCSEQFWDWWALPSEWHILSIP